MIIKVIYYILLGQWQASCHSTYHPSHAHAVYTREGEREREIRYCSIKEISPSANQILALLFSTEDLNIPCIGFQNYLQVYKKKYTASYMQ